MVIYLPQLYLKMHSSTVAQFDLLISIRESPHMSAPHSINYHHVNKNSKTNKNTYYYFKMMSQKTTCYPSQRNNLNVIRVEFVKIK